MSEYYIADDGVKCILFPKLVGKHTSLPTDRYTDEELKAVYHSRRRHWTMLFKRLNKATVECQAANMAMQGRGLL